MDSTRPPPDSGSLMHYHYRSVPGLLREAAYVAMSAVFEPGLLAECGGALKAGELADGAVQRARGPPVTGAGLVLGAS